MTATPTPTRISPARSPAFGEGSPITAPLARLDITDRAEAAERAEPNEAAEPTENAEAAEPIENAEAAEPTEPIESTERREPIDSSESSDQSERLDSPTPALA